MTGISVVWEVITGQGRRQTGTRKKSPCRVIAPEQREKVKYESD